MLNKDLKKRILEISYKHKLAHVGSCLSAVDIIEGIYRIKKKDEKFILSAGHFGLAQYVVIEKYEGINAEDIFNHHGTHPDRCEQCHLDCSTGSLGLGFSIAVGMALADRNKKVYCLLSDGECAEGIVYESLNLIEEQKIDNLMIHINMNGFGAYRKIDTDKLSEILFAHVPSMKDNIHIHLTNLFDFPFLKGLDAHYHILTEEESHAC